MDKKAQGSIEYLLIIAAAILVVAVVIIAIIGITSSAGTGTDTAVSTEQKASMGLGCASDCSFTINGLPAGTTCHSLGLPVGNVCPSS